MLLYIVRHGDPIYTTDTLTERGKLQAEAVGKRIYDSKIDRIFSSPMGRARETAEPACRLLGLPCNIEDWTEEITPYLKTPYPDGEPKSITYIQNTVYRENGNIDLGYNDTFKCTAICESRMYEALELVKTHGNEFLKRLGYSEENGVYRILRPNEEKVALFCHASMARVWLCHLLHIPVHTMWSSFMITHTGVTILEFKNNENGITAPKCLCFSDVSHLYAAGLDLLHDNKTEM
ncbi:MAG: histidine phosphatase family protein [Ruminococcaceae bacterium]|nr:histidine phosphatase family protein [Oscillospiraceae bacterium]